MALHYAAKFDHLDTVRQILLCRRALVGLGDALQLCSSSGCRELIKQAIHRRQTDIVNQELFECAVNGNAGKLFCLLEPGDETNVPSAVGDWPLYIAAENGHADVVILLHERGGDINRIHPSTGNSILHVACSRGHHDIIQYLLGLSNSHPSRKENKVDINGVNKAGKTPLQLAAETGSSKIVRLLLNNGASTAILDKNFSLYQCANYQGVQVLIETHREEHTRQVMHHCRDKRGLNNLKKIWQPNFDHNLRDKDGDTPLMVACRHGRMEVINFLLESAVVKLVTDQTLEVLDMNRDSSNIFEPEQPPTFDVTKERIPPVGNSRESSCFEMDGNQGAELPDLLENQHTRLRRKMSFGTEDTRQYTVSYAPTNPFSEETNTYRNSDVVTYSKLRMPSYQRLAVSSPFLDSSSVLDDKSSVQLPDDESEASYCNPFFKSITSPAGICGPGSISHVCAVSHTDGRTPLHRTIECGDCIPIINALIKADESCANIQDKHGLSPLHLACKLGRKKSVEKLTSLPYVDLNSRTLDTELPEEMTPNKKLIQLVTAARENQPQQQQPSSPTPSSSGISSRTGDRDYSVINIDNVNQMLQDLRQSRLNRRTASTTSS